MHSIEKTRGTFIGTPFSRVQAKITDQNRVEWIVGDPLADALRLVDCTLRRGLCSSEPGRVEERCDDGEDCHGQCEGETVEHDVWTAI